MAPDKSISKELYIASIFFYFYIQYLNESNYGLKGYES